MKRLLLLVPAFPKDEASSYTVPFIQQFVMAFSRDFGVSLDIMSLYEPSGGTYEWKGLKVIPLNGPMKGSLLKKVFFILKSARLIKQQHKREHYDGILSFWYRETALIGRLAANRIKLPHYTWLQGQDVKRTNKYMRIVRPNPNSLIALSEYQNNFLFDSFGIKAPRVAPVAINPGLMPAPSHRERPIDILGAGSLTPIKNHRFFLEIVAEVKKKRNDLNVFLIGNGPLEKEYRDFIKDNGLEDTVTLTGLLSHSETMKYMNRSRVFIHTSKYEGGGMVCLESLYLGCQLISTLPLIKNAPSKFYHSTDKKEIVNHIHRVLENKLTPISSHIENPMEATCKVIYDLFY